MACLSFRRSQAWVVLPACFIALACGGTPSTDGSGGAAPATGGSASGGTASSSGGATSGSGGQAGGAASGGAASGGSDPGTTSIGRVQVYRTLAMGADDSGRVMAQFDYVEQEAWDAVDAGQACTSQQLGACTVTTCEPGTEPDPSDLPSTVRLHAGTIMLTPDRDDFTASGMPSGEDNAYAFTSSGTLLGEEIMTVTNSGGTISAFQGMVQVPLAPFLTSHDATAAEQGVVVAISTPRTADLVLAWDARGTADEIQTIVTYPSDDSPRIGCKFPATPGSGSIPGSALALLPAGTEIHLFAVNTASVTTPEGTVDLVGALEMFSPDRTGYPMFVLE